jgi:hypothetical protein
MISPNGGQPGNAGPFMQVEPDASLTANWPIGQAQQFYGEMARRLSAVMTLLDTIPITEMLAVNARLRTMGVLSLPPEVTADQAQAWQANLNRDNDLFRLLVRVLAQVKGQ